jgi:hypothetical protein
VLYIAMTLFICGGWLLAAGWLERRRARRSRRRYQADIMRRLDEAGKEIRAGISATLERLDDALPPDKQPPRHELPDA